MSQSPNPIVSAIRRLGSDESKDRIGSSCWMVDIGCVPGHGMLSFLLLVLGVDDLHSTTQTDKPSPSTAEQRQREGTSDRTELKGPFGRPAIRVGRIFGIKVGLDWSWLFSMKDLSKEVLMRWWDQVVRWLRH